MSFSKEAHIYATDTLKARRDNAIRTQSDNTSKIHSSIPRIFEIDRDLAQTSIKIARIMLSSSDTKSSIEELKANNLKLQNEKRDLLFEHGYPSDYLDIKYTCSYCEDTGHIGSNICSCYKKLLKEYSINALNTRSPLKLSAFDSFDITLYPSKTDVKTNKNTRMWMQKILEYCIDYSKDFHIGSPNLIFFGETGLGKTHLSLAIANNVIENGFNVLYGSFPDLMNTIEKEHFSQNKSQESSLDTILNCDLLILDDLGAEMTTQFTISTLYTIINSRIIAEKPTIISTNLRLNEIESKYSQRIASRLIGEYEQFLFIGDDIRQILKEKRK